MNLGRLDGRMRPSPHGSHMVPEGFDSARRKGVEPQLNYSEVAMKHKKPMKHKKAKAGTTPQWDKLKINGEKLDVLRVWQVKPQKWPETAILRARSTAAKQQVENDAILQPFLDNNGVLSKPVNTIQRVSVLPSASTSPCTTPHWDYLVMHGKASNIIVIQVPCFK
jgi:hypothetical protein